MKKLFLLISGLLILVSVPVTIFFIQQNQELRSRAAPATTMSLSPSTVQVEPGETFQLDATIDTGSNQIVAVEIHLTYDPEKLEALNITSSTLFPNILSSGVIDNGTASIVVGAPSTAQPVSGTGTAATIRFRAISATSTPITVRYTADTFAGSPGEGATNALIGTTPSTITIGEGGSQTGTPTPTPTEEPDVSGTVTPTPTESAGTSPTGTLTPTPTLSAGTGGTDASASGIIISTPIANTTVSTDMPTFSGTAPVGSTVTITIYSEDPVTGVVLADEDGNWSFTPDIALADGPHTVVVSATDPVTSTAYNATSSFVVDTAGAGSGQTTQSTQSSIPVSGTTELTYIIIGIAMLLLVAGLIVPIVL